MLGALANSVKCGIYATKAFINLPGCLGNTRVGSRHFLTQLGRSRLDADEHPIYVGIGHAFLQAIKNPPKWVFLMN
jgi:hypothetical protein